MSIITKSYYVTINEIMFQNRAILQLFYGLYVDGKTNKVITWNVPTL